VISIGQLSSYSHFEVVLLLLVDIWDLF